MEVRSILITGGLGNLGSWLTRHFSQQKYEVTVLTKNKRQLEIEAHYNLIYCDISSPEDCREKLNEYFDVVIHAASVNDHFVENYPEKALQVNAWGTRNILEALRENPPKQFIYLSTFHVYGKNSGSISEKTDLRPRNDYGLTHLFAEQYIRQFHENHQFPYTIVRLSNSYGCPLDYNSSKWYLILNDLSKMAFQKNKIALRGNGLAARDFIWMGDVCHIFEELANKKALNDTFNLSAEKSTTLLEVAEGVQSAYQLYFEQPIEIQVNRNDKESKAKELKINAQKLKSIVSYEADQHFEDEALKIFKFLKNQ